MDLGEIERCAQEWHQTCYGLCTDGIDLAKWWRFNIKTRSLYTIPLLIIQLSWFWTSFRSRILFRRGGIGLMICLEIRLHILYVWRFANFGQAIFGFAGRIISGDTVLLSTMPSWICGGQATACEKAWTYLWYLVFCHEKKCITHVICFTESWHVPDLDDEHGPTPHSLSQTTKRSATFVHHELSVCR